MSIEKELLLVFMMALPTMGNLCTHTLGMKSGIITDAQILSPTQQKRSVRYGHNNVPCYQVKEVTVDFKKMMTIKGFEIFSNVELRGMQVKLNKIRFLTISSADPNRTPRTFDYTTSNRDQRVLFENNPFTVQTITIVLPSTACFRVEFLGCAEVCNKLLNAPSLFQGNDVLDVNKKIQCRLVGTPRVIKFTKTLTISGIEFYGGDFLLSDAEFTCKKYGKVSTIITIDEQYTEPKKYSYWFDKQQECDEVIVKTTAGGCGEFVLLGCDKGCMNPLGIQRNLSSSTSGNLSSNSFLHNLDGSWQVNSNGYKFVEVCWPTKKTITGIGVRSQGYVNFGHVKIFRLGYKEKRGGKTMEYRTSDGNTDLVTNIRARHATYVYPLSFVVAECLHLEILECANENSGGCALRLEVYGCDEALPFVNVVKENYDTTGNAKCKVEAPQSPTVNWYIEGKTFTPNPVTTLYSPINNMYGTYQSELPRDNIYQLAIAPDKYKTNCHKSEKVICNVNVSCRVSYNGKTKEDVAVISVSGFDKTVKKPSIQNVTSSKTSCVISWSNPDSNPVFPTVKFYIAIKQQQQQQQQQQAFIQESITVPHTFTFNNLKPFTDYVVVLKGLNFFNDSSEPVERLCKTLETEASPPLNLTLIPQNHLAMLKVEWSTPSYINGNIKYYKISYTGKKDYNKTFEDTNQTNENSFNTNPIVHELNVHPGSTYTVTVRLVNGAGEGEPATKTIKIPNGKPHTPVIHMEETPSETRIVLNAPEQLTGPISYYHLVIAEGDCNKIYLLRATIRFTSTKTLKILKSEKTFTVEGKNVELDLTGSYHFCLRAVVIGDIIGDYGSVSVVRRELPLPKAPSSRTSSTTTINIPAIPEIANFIVIILQKQKYSSNENDIRPSELTSFDENKEFKPYLTGVIDAKNNDGLFKIGDGKNYSYNGKIRKRSIRSLEKYASIFNVPLEEGVNYYYIVRAHVNESVYYSTRWIALSEDNNKPNTIKPNPAAYIGGVVGAVVAVVLIVIVVFVVKRRFWRTVLQKDNNQGLMEFISPVIENDNSEKNDIIEEHHYSNMEGVHKIPPNKLEIDERHPITKVDSFTNSWEGLKKNSYQKLSKEYLELNSGQLYDWSEASLPHLKPKNRYGNIVTYNHSKVKLLSKSDYINASSIHGYSEKNMYIATQGPSPKTYNDFWCMIWDYNVGVIVVVTNLLENKKVKCDKYWPDQSSTTYGEIKVEHITQEMYADFVIRTFSIKKSGESKDHTVKQYHYLSWPDHGVPEYPSDLLNFRHKIRKNHPVEDINSPVVVHCSAGVGRSGTFIAIDNLLKLASEKNQVDVFNYVNFMRTRRIHMVQTEEQYVFIYRALYEAFICGYTEIMLTRYEIEMKDLIEKDPNMEKRGVDKQFDTLNMVAPKLKSEEISASIADENKQKNREEIYARDISRVMLSFDVDKKKALGDYINAIYVNGYKKKDAFIATQHPLINTILDFWRMVFEKNVPVVVMLHGFTGNDKNLEKICPSQTETMNFEPISVQFKSEELKNGFQIRDLVLKNSNKKGQMETCVIAYDKWMKDKAPVARDFISLLALVDKKLGAKNNSVVVMCSDGARQCGTYIAASILLEQVKMERSVDVFQTVKKIRLSRPEFVSDKVQYEFLYTLIRAYLDSFNTYDNFTRRD